MNVIIFVTVCNWTLLKNKHILCYLWFGLFLTCEKTKKSDIYILLQEFMNFSFYAPPLNMILLELQGMWLVRTGPLCPHAHSVLIFTSPFPLIKVFIVTLTAFPTGMLDLDALV
jgi:hypothetical protein